jgi:signal transduction histidine kinase
MEQSDSGSGASPGLEKDLNSSPSESLEQVNAELSKQNFKLRALAERRSASLAHLAHELRTPLTSILGFSEILLSQEKLTDAQRNFCERIQNSAHQLQNSLNQLAELSRWEIGSDDQTPSD